MSGSRLYSGLGPDSTVTGWSSESKKYTFSLYRCRLSVFPPMFTLSSTFTDGAVTLFTPCRPSTQVVLH